MAVLSVEPKKKEKAIWPAKNSIWCKVFEAFAKFILKYWSPLSVHGINNLPDKPFLIASNHQSHMDSAMLCVAAGLDFRDVGLIAAKDYFFEKSYRRLVTYFLNLIPITRGKGPQSIRETSFFCHSFLKEGGQALVIYPEGTRTLDGQIKPFKQGTAILAHELNIPIVPALIKGSFKAFPKGTFFIRPKKVSVTFGPSFFVADFLKKEVDHERRKTFSAYRKATLELEMRVRSLS